MIHAPFHHHSITTTTTMFDPLSNYFDPIPRPPPASLLNLDPIWSKSSRSDPNSGEINPVHPSTSSYQPFFTPQPNHFISTLLSSQFPALPENTTPRTTSSSDHTRIGVRNPKKRSSASRRAPTIVLTTDTTKFRAMVQEFTGIPAPPFASSSFPRSSFPKPPPSLGRLNSFIHLSAQLEPSHTHLKIGGLDEFGLTHGLTHELPSLVSSDGATRDNPVNWGGGGGGGFDGGGHHGKLRGINENFDYSSSKNTTTVKVNYLGSSSNFQREANGGSDYVI